MSIVYSYLFWTAYKPLASVTTTTMRSGRAVIESVPGTPIALISYWNTVWLWKSTNLMIKSTHADCLGPIKEMAYTFRYVINNGRAEGSQWSIRQTAVYQNMDVRTGCSTWILIQPDDAVLHQFKNVCLQSSDVAFHLMAPHLVFLGSAQVHWKAYIGQLRLALQSLVGHLIIKAQCPCRWCV